MHELWFARQMLKKDVRHFSVENSVSYRGGRNNEHTHKGAEFCKKGISRVHIKRDDLQDEQE